MKIRQWIGCVLALGGLVVGCAVPTDEPGSASTTAAGTVLESPFAAVAEDIAPDEHLTRLERLALFEVGELILLAPAEATQCYGPCPSWEAMTPEEQEAEIAAADAVQAARLAGLVAIAEDVREQEVLPEVDPTTAERHLSAIAALRIVEVGDLIVSEAAPSPYCYNLPCPGAEAQAAEQNAARAAELAAIAARAAEL